MVNAGIFGPKLSGKTTLAQSLSREAWRKWRMRSLVLDPNGDEWGPQALSMSDETKFWELVWKAQNCLVIIDEAAATIRRERTLVPVFTKMRHQKHKMIVIGHSGMDLLPVMRQQLDTLYLFRQPDEACKVWVSTFTQKGLFEAANLNQFEFIFTTMYGQPRKLILPPP
jgi:hypothetical protein